MTEKRRIKDQNWELGYVLKGDTWEDLAKQAGVTVAELQEINHVKQGKDALHIADAIWLPERMCI
jgi:hypothetical protein